MASSSIQKHTVQEKTKVVHCVETNLTHHVIICSKHKNWYSVQYTYTVYSTVHGDSSTVTVLYIRPIRTVYSVYVTIHRTPTVNCGLQYSTVSHSLLYSTVAANSKGRWLTTYDQYVRTYIRILHCRTNGQRTYAN